MSPSIKSALTEAEHLIILIIIIIIIIIWTYISAHIHHHSNLVLKNCTGIITCTHQANCSFLKLMLIVHKSVKYTLLQFMPFLNCLRSNHSLQRNSALTAIHVTPGWREPTSVRRDLLKDISTTVAVLSRHPDDSGIRAQIRCTKPLGHGAPFRNHMSRVTRHLSSLAM